MTTQQRNKLYKEALKVIAKGDTHCSYICHALKPYSVKDFDEFLLVMPSKWQHNCSLFGADSETWFTDEEFDTIIPRDLRETILCLCIAMTE